jgi:hypothetical protein
MKSYDVPSAEVSEHLFTLSEKLQKYATSYPITNLEFWTAVIEQIDTLASVIAEEDQICDTCGRRIATGADRQCDYCAMDSDFAEGADVA